MMFLDLLRLGPQVAALAWVAAYDQHAAAWVLLLQVSAALFGHVKGKSRAVALYNAEVAAHQVTRECRTRDAKDHLEVSLRQAEDARVLREEVDALCLRCDVLDRSHE